MPIFEYRCRTCGARFEKYLPNGTDQIVCRECASANVDQLLSVFAVAGDSRSEATTESGPCPCGAPRRGMCGE